MQTYYIQHTCHGYSMYSMGQGTAQLKSGKILKKKNKAKKKQKENTYCMTSNMNYGWA